MRRASSRFCAAAASQSVMRARARHVTPSALITARSYLSHHRSPSMPVVKPVNSVALSRRSFAAAKPPHSVIGMPALSPTMEKGNLARWALSEGDSFSAGDVLAEIETDKATVDFEATEDGILAKILVPAGTRDIPVNAPVAVTVEEESDVAAFADFSLEGGEEVPEEKTPEKEEKKAAPAPASAPTAKKGGARKSYPMHDVLGMPALSPTMEKGNIAKWHKSVGDAVSASDVLAEIETDKATVDFEATDDGFVAAILASEGDKDIPVGTPVVVLVENEEDIAAFADFSSADAGGESDTAGESDAVEVQATETKQEATPKPASARPKAAGERRAGGGPAHSEVPGAPPQFDVEPRSGIVASPRAKAAAARLNVDLTTVSGSGPGGRIVESDVSSAAASPRAAEKPAAAAKKPAAAATAAPSKAAPSAAGALYTDEPVSQIRSVIAQRLTESKQQIPHYYLTMDCKVDELLKLRARLNKAANGEYKLSVNDFIVKASALSCGRVPEVNSSWQGDFIRRYHTVDVNVAVATDKGLLTPLLNDADKLGLQKINTQVKDLAVAAQSGKLHPEKMQPGTFTISNLGMFGISSFSAVIMPPQACILAVGGTQERVFADPSSETGFRTASVMSVTLSCDHRVVDGAVGAKWLQQFKSYVEDPTTMLL